MNSRPQFARARAIQDSLAAFAVRCADPASLVYARVFAAHPGVEDRFRRDARGLVRGEMLSRAFDVILDYVEERRYADAMVRAEMVTHESYDVHQRVFASFFECIRDAVREAIAESWTADVEDAWCELLVELAALAGVAPGGGEAA